MPRYSVAEARTRLADALSQAEAGVPVVIERRGVRFHLTLAPEVTRTRRAPALVEILDPAVERGQWTWQLNAAGAKFKAPRRRRS